MEETRPIYVGTELKYTLNIETEGFSMDTDDFKIIVRSSHGTIEIPKSQMILTDNDEYLFTVDTSELGAGDYYVSVVAYVPDTDFDDGLRTEVTKQLLCVVKS